MGNRFETVLSHIDDGLGVIDVGTDHGYVPIRLAINGYSGNIIATDINYLPLNKAKNNAEKFDVLDKIDFVLADGLQNCDPKLIDTIIICGMGGDLICDILDRAEWTMSSSYKLILQPMSKCEILRFWLVNNGYNIINDEVINDKGRSYQLIISRYSGINECYTDGELFVGKSPNQITVKKALKGLRKIPANPFYSNIIKELDNYENQ